MCQPQPVWYLYQSICSLHDARGSRFPQPRRIIALPQVILKPDPGRPQELYLGSLEALGIDTRAHDVRFVEDNWENPTLGAWGLGWEVWMDGRDPPSTNPCLLRQACSLRSALLYTR